MSKVNVHIICNAHLDPVWYWPWQAGLDEIIATCRTMCNLLDKNEDVIFTANEAWRYSEIEDIDPDLFIRIKRLVESGRWALTGGWWLQPDCNFPSGEGMRQQISLGKEFFLDRFGEFPEVGYNVDSFGHAATLPTIMHESGQRYYVMMRPMADEMDLPARLFRWKETPDSPEILTFRIANAYCTNGEVPDLSHIHASITDLPEGVNDTMCYLGVGDHGGGPTQKMIDWVRENSDKHDDFRLIFSSPKRYFDAVAKDADKTPEVIGELQYHAIGCYSVMRSIKKSVRKAEHMLTCAQNISREQDRPALKEAWKATAFNQFHDIIGGTSSASSYVQQCALSDGATATADGILQRHLRRKYAAMPADELQRIVVCNPSPEKYEGYIDHEASLRSYTWKPGERLIDESGNEVAYQKIPCEHANDSTGELNTVTGAGGRLLWDVNLDPGETKVFRMERKPATDVISRVDSLGDTIKNDCGVAVDLAASGGLFLGQSRFTTIPDIAIIEDKSDNWTHRVDRYLEGPVHSVNWNRTYSIENGPLRASLGRQGDYGKSSFRAEWRVCADQPWIELIVDVMWAQRQELAKLVLPLDGKVATRIDGIMGGSLERPNSGRECPLQDWTYFELESGKLGVVSPDIYALDANERRLRLTLLRSPILTHHDPETPYLPHATYTDQGEHRFHIRFCLGEQVTPEYLAGLALQMHRPPLTGDLTKGMPCQ